MKRPFGLLILAFFSSFSFAADTNVEINALLETIRAKHGLPALAGAVFNHDGLVAQGATGFRKKNEKEKVTGKDLWHIGSDTKVMTATLVGSFVAEKKLSWDDTVEKYFPEFAERIHPKLRTVTIAQLLSHRAGLTPNLEWDKFETRNLTRARKEAAKELLTNEPSSPVGEFSYTNSGYVVVGAILEKVSGKTWENLLTERIFDSLGIKSAGFGGTGTKGKLDQPWGHLESGNPVESNGPDIDNPPMAGPAGRVHLTVADWTLFLTDQLRGGNGKKAILPAEIYAAIQTPHPADAIYGLGWGISKRPWAGGKTLSHAGSNTMNFAICWLAIPKQFGILICTNQAGDVASKASDEALQALIEWNHNQPKTP